MKISRVSNTRVRRTISIFITVLVTSNCILAADGSATYLLITNEELAPEFQLLVERRTAQGFPGKLVTVESISERYSAIDIPEKIRNCVKDHYLNHNTLYVALGGDNTIVPLRHCYTGIRNDILPADLYYSDMDGGDWDADGDRRYGEPGDVGAVELIPEVHLGRIPVRTTDHAAAYVNKVIIYEEASPEDYAGSVLLGGSSPNYQAFSGETRPPGFEDHDPVAAGEINVTSWYLEHVQPYARELPVHRYFHTNSHWDKLRCGDAPWGPSYLEAHLNEGYQLLLYAAHAASVGWGMGAGFFRESYAQQLTNPFPCIVVAGGCEIAGFDLTEPSLSEAFLRNPKGGAVAFFGFTRTGGSGISRTELSSELFRNRQTSIGQAFTRSKITLASNLVKHPWRQCMFVLLGDPLIHLIPEREGRHLQIFQPKGLETIRLDSDVYIRWNAAGTGFGSDELVKLQYSADSGQTWYDIPGAEGLPYDGGLFIWEGHDLPLDSTYKIRVTSLSDPQVSDISDRDFTIGRLGLLKIKSENAKPVKIEGSYGNWTNYDVSVLLGESVSLTAPLVPGEMPELEFRRWKDEAGTTLSDSQNYTFTFTQDTTVIAEYEYPSRFGKYYVNDEVAEGGVAAGDDDNDGLSPQRPMRHIQALLDRYRLLGWEDIINVSPGTYRENIILGESHAGLMLNGAGQDVCVIDGGRKGSCIQIDDLTNGIIISGFTVKNGAADKGAGINCNKSFTIIKACTFTNNHANGRGGGFYNDRDSDPQLMDCRFIENSSHQGGGIYSFRSKPILTNCMFTGNRATWGAGAFNGLSTVEIVNCTFNNNVAKVGGAISNFWDSFAKLSDCILWGDSPSEIYISSGKVTATFSDVQGGWPGEGNISIDPLFADPDNGDFHLKSQAGRYDPDSHLKWVRDSQTSPCIDAGDPDIPVSEEPEPNGGRINMGTYGGTSEASKSP